MEEEEEPQSVCDGGAGTSPEDREVGSGIRRDGEEKVWKNGVTVPGTLVKVPLRWPEVSSGRQEECVCVREGVYVCTRVCICVCVCVRECVCVCV